MLDEEIILSHFKVIFIANLVSIATYTIMPYRQQQHGFVYFAFAGIIYIFYCILNSQSSPFLSLAAAFDFVVLLSTPAPPAEANNKFGANIKQVEMGIPCCRKMK